MRRPQRTRRTPGTSARWCAALQSCGPGSSAAGWAMARACPAAGPRSCDKSRDAPETSIRTMGCGDQRACWGSDRVAWPAGQPLPCAEDLQFRMIEIM
jgi:hypothetical protein